MQRTAQRPGADDRAVGDGRLDRRFGVSADEPQTDGPERPEEILGLNRPESRDEFARTRVGGPIDALMDQPLAGKITWRHARQGHGCAWLGLNWSGRPGGPPDLEDFAPQNSSGTRTTMAPMTSPVFQSFRGLPGCWL